MQELHLVGFTTDLEQLIFSVRKGAKSGGYTVSLDEQLLTVIAEAVRMRRAVGADVSDAAAAVEAAVREGNAATAAKAESALTPREIQARLRAGRTVKQVAKAAGVTEAWIERFAAPVRGEQAQMAERARSLVFSKPRLGESAEPLGLSVRWNVAEKGVRFTEQEFEEHWSAYQFQDHVWVIRFAFESRKREHVAEWILDIETNELLHRNRLASDLGYLEPGKRRKISDLVPEPADLKEDPASSAADDEEKSPSKRTASRTARARTSGAQKSGAKRSPAKKPAAKKTTGKRSAKKSAANTSAGKRAAAKKPAKKASAKRSAAKKPAKKASAKRSAAKKTSARKTTKKGARRAAPAAKRAEAPSRPPAAEKPTRPASPWPALSAGAVLPSATGATPVPTVRRARRPLDSAPGAESGPAGRSAAAGGPGRGDTPPAPAPTDPEPETPVHLAARSNTAPNPDGGDQRTARRARRTRPAQDVAAGDGAGVPVAAPGQVVTIRANRATPPLAERPDADQRPAPDEVDEGVVAPPRQLRPAIQARPPRRRRYGNRG